MKIKEQIIKWRDEVRQLTQQSKKVADNSAIVFEEVKLLKEQVSSLAKITEEMTETMLSLLRQQIGD